MASKRHQSVLTTLTLLILLACEPLCSALSTTNRNVPGLKNGMDYAKLGSSDLIVSRVCMGTMTFGEVSSALRSFSMFFKECCMSGY